VILLDMNFSKDTTSGKEGFQWLAQIKEKDPDAVVIMITAFGDVEMAVRALKEGATDFILNPWQNEKLIATISTAIRLKKSYNEVDKLRKAKQMLEEKISQPFRDIIGQSQAIKDVFNLIDKGGQDGRQHSYPRRKRHGQGTGRPRPSTKNRYARIIRLFRSIWVR